jgi:hypothetical protein
MNVRDAIRTNLLFLITILQVVFSYFQCFVPIFYPKSQSNGPVPTAEGLPTPF